MRDGTQSSQLVRFGVYEVDLRSGELRKNGLKLKLSGQPFQVLGLLLERPGQLVTREEIQKRLWPADTFVDFDHSLNTAINKIRETVGDSAENPRFVETLPRRGYRFIMPVEVGALVADPSPGPASARQPSPSGRGAGGEGVAGDATSASVRHPQGVLLQESAVLREPPQPTRWGLRLAAMLAMLVVGAAVAWYALERSRPKPELVQHQLTTNSSELAVTASAISPDGRYLAYADDSGIHLRVIDTAETHDLPTPKDSRINKLAWFPEGNKLLASGETGLPRAPSLWTVSILGGLAQKLRDDSADGNVFQDGTGIVFVGGDGKEIWQMSPAGEEARKVITAPEGEFFATPVVVEGRLWYAKHHASVAFWARAWGSLRGLEYELESRDLKGGPSTILRPKLRATSGTLLPNGRFIFSRINRPHDPSQGGSLWEISADLRTGQARGEPRRIADWADLVISDLTATADGKRLAYVKERGLVSVYTGDLESNGLRLVNPRRLTLSESYDHAYDWTSDSKSVLFDSNRNGTWEVFKQTLNQRTAERLVGGVRPAMGPDGVSVLYLTPPTYSRYPPPTRIMRVVLAGGSPQLLGDVQNSSVIRCARRAELCVVNESDRKGMVLYALDPVKGKGRELWRIGRSLLPEHDRDYDVTIPEWDWDVSPDGSSITLATRSAQKGIIQIRSLASGAVRELSLSGWAHPINARWSPDGKGWFLIARSTKGLAFKGTGLLRPPGSPGLLAASTKDLASEGTEWPSLLRVDLEGNVQVLVQECAWSDPVISPDGRHLALAGPAITRNVWMLENF